jgi:hypothetical protein
MSIKRLAATVLIVSVVVLAVVVKSTHAVSQGRGLDSSGFAGDATARALRASGATSAGGGPLDHIFNISNLIDTKTEGPSIAYNGNRDEYLVVWWNQRPGNNSDDIYGRRVSGGGALIGDWFAIAYGTGHERRCPDVAYNSHADEYLVVWHDIISTSTLVFAQRVSAAGQLLGDEIAIGGDGDLNWGPQVAYASTENKYLVVWVEYAAAAWALAGKEVSSTGSPGSRFSIDSDCSLCEEIMPGLAYNRAGNEFLVVWSEHNGSDYDVHGQRVGMTGSAGTVGPTFSIFQSASDEWAPAVAALPGRGGQGQYLVVCETTAGWILGQLVAADGSLEGPLIDISPFPDGASPAVAGSEDAAQFLVAWTQEHSLPPPNNKDILGRPISIDGNPVRERAVIGGPSADHAAAASGSLGDFLVVFDGLPPEGGSSMEVYGRLWGNRVYLPLVLR